MKTLLLIISLLVTTGLSAQMYERSVGVRVGYSTGIFFDKQNDDLSNYRFMMSTREGGRHFTAMKFFRRYKTDRLPDYLSVYYGYGLHVGFVKWYDGEYDPNYGNYLAKKSSSVLGLDAMFGISYDLEKRPISITCDVKPFIDLLGHNSFEVKPWDISFGMVYSF